MLKVRLYNQNNLNDRKFIINNSSLKFYCLAGYSVLT